MRLIFTRIKAFRFVFFLIPLLLSAYKADAQAVVTPAPDLLDLCVGDAYKTLGTITVSETVDTDFGSGSFTYILVPPPNFEFDPASGSASVSGGADISSIGQTQGASAFTVSYTHALGGSVDAFQITGLRIRAITTASVGNITESGGTSPVAGNGFSHGRVESDPALVAAAGSDITDLCVSESATIGGSPSATGGAGSYTYSWSAPSLGTLSANNVANPEYTGTSSGTETLTLTINDGNGCIDTDDIEITVNAGPSAPSATDPTPICVNDAVPSLTATGTNIEWYSDPGLTTNVGSGSPFDPSAVVDNTVAGTYLLYATQTNGSGCESAATVVTVVVNPEVIAAAGSDDAVCVGATLVLGGTPTATGGSGSYSYSWTAPTLGSLDNSSSHQSNIYGQQCRNRDPDGHGDRQQRLCRHRRYRNYGQCRSLGTLSDRPNTDLCK